MGKEDVVEDLLVQEVEGGKEVTIDGCTVTLRDAAFKDHMVVRQLAKMRKGNLPAADMIIINGELIDRILGEEQADLFVEAFADEHGFTDFTVLSEKFNRVVRAAYPN